MITKREIDLEVDGLMSLRSLVEVYEEVAAGRMQKVRGAVVQSREFLYGLLEVFKRVKEAYRKEVVFEEEWRKKNGKTVAVFISANAGLYGDIVDKTFNMFAKYVTESKPEVVILGKLGIKMMTENLSTTLYNYFDFPDDNVELESFDMVMRYLIQFEKIVVFYGQFKTILTQDPTMTSVSGDVVEARTEEVQADPRKTKFIFEPSAQDISNVFEGEILSSLFEQTLHESQLAKFASRLLALDRSIDNIDTRMKRVHGEAVKIKHKATNRKQLTVISGISLWGHG
jgi:F-type H+-transporting ATPase subunit gamma